MDSKRKKKRGFSLPVLAVGFVAAGTVAVWYNMTPAPTGGSMIPLDTLDIADGDPIVTVKLPAKLSSDAQIGKRIFEAKCAICHGKNAAGRSGVAPPFVYKIYEPAHHGDAAFVMAAKLGVRSHHWKFGDMPPVEGITDGEVKYIARYVRELQRENGIK